MMDARTDIRQYYCVFDTPIGACGIAWSEHGITRFRLPEATRAATERRMARGAQEAEPPPRIANVIAEVLRYCAGTKIDFTSVALDMPDVVAFHRQVYEAARAVGWGETASYGDLAREIGAPGEAREVGQALARNPIPLIVPCHRILTSDGKLGGFSAPGGTATKERLLALEGVRVGVDPDAPLLPGF
jgi:methylated-DNA-[protein]-cysteine S-methyltransferase